MLLGTDIWYGAQHQGFGYLRQNSTDTHDLGNQLVGSGMHNGGHGGMVWCGLCAGCGSEGALVDRKKIGGWGVRLAYTYYVCVCYGDANAHMPSLVLAGCSAQSRSVFGIGQSMESQGNSWKTFLCCVAWRELRFVALGSLSLGVWVSPWQIHLSYCRVCCCVSHTIMLVNEQEHTARYSK